MMKPFILTCNVLTIATGYSLAQLNSEGKEPVIEYGGQLLNSYVKNYSVTEHKYFTVLDGKNAYIMYLSHRKKSIQTIKF